MEEQKLLPSTGKSLYYYEPELLSTIKIQAHTGDSRYMRFRISAVLFQYHEEHQYPIRGHGRRCTGPLSCARSFTDSPNLFDSGDCKVWPLMVYHSENPRAC
jgi:hypothetical protein